MPIYLFRCESCEHEQDEIFHVSQEKEREAGVQCSECGGHSARIFASGMGYIKNTYIGDLFDQADVTNDPMENKRRNSERIKDMRDRKTRGQDPIKKPKIISGPGGKYLGSRFE